MPTTSFVFRNCLDDYPLEVIYAPMYMHRDDCMGDVISKLLKRSPQYKDVILESEFRDVNTKIPYGQHPLSKNLGQGDINILVSFSVSSVYAIKNAYFAWTYDKLWPPCLNYYEDEPLNHQRIGLSDSCDLVMGEKHNNHVKNMFILSYGPELQQKRAYNIYMFQEWIETCFTKQRTPTDPCTGSELTDMCISSILGLREGNFVEVDATL